MGKEPLIQGSVFDTQTLDRDVVQFEDYLTRLTPVQKIGGMWFKREDFFAPLGYGGVNGSKLRQLIWLINGYYKHGQNPKGVVSGAVTGSPQHPMAAIIAAHYGLEYLSVVGTANVGAFPTLILAAKYGATFAYSPVGYAKTLESKAIQIAREKDYFLVETNIVVNSNRNHKDRVKAFHEVGGFQVNNIPETIETLIIPCGSGTSTISIMHGLREAYLPNLSKIVLMGIGNIGSKDIDFIFRRLNWMNGKHTYPEVEHLNLNGTGYCKYEQLMPASYHGIEFHPRYEGKCIKYLQQYKPEYFNETTMFWIVGSEPKF